MSEVLSIVTWNVQSPGEFGGSADPDVISGHIKEFHGYDIYAFCEVFDKSWSDGFKAALEDSEQDEFTSILGTTGWGGDKLLVLFRHSTLSQTGDFVELIDMKEGGGRAPLVVPLKVTAADVDFKFVLNHLHSSDTSKRLRQCEALNKWADQQETPLVAAGDYNFFDVRAGSASLADQGFERITKDGLFSWVRPQQLMPTQFDPKIDIDWILDFVFVGGDAKTWKATSEILLADKKRAYFLTPEMTDHRPVNVRFQL